MLENILLISPIEWLENTKFLNISLIDFHDFGKLLFRFAFNTLVLWILIKFLYSRKGGGRKEFNFSYMAIGSAIFLLCFLLESVKIELGFALGLFAIFGIIRYRTDAIPIKEMTYLFVVIGIAVLNALANKKVSYAELVLTNAGILMVLYCLERFVIGREANIDVVFERIEQIKISDKEAVKADIEARTGIKVKRFTILKVDFLKDAAILRIYYDK